VEALKRRLTLGSALLIGLLTSTLAAQSLPSPRAMGVVVDLSGSSPEFIDAAKTSRPWEALSGGPALVDEAGWPRTDAKTVFFDYRPVFAWAPPIDDPQAFQIDVSGRYRLEFTGQAVLKPNSQDPGAQTFTVENQSYDAKLNRTTADLVLAKGKALLYVDFTQTKGGVRDVRLIRPGFSPETSEIFHPALLKALEPFRVMRFLYNNVNPAFDAPKNTTEWSDRTLTTDANQALGGLDGMVAWEYHIALANRTGKDLWLTLPAAASEDYLRKLAELMFATLKPEIAVYLEDSNEVWNPLFLQYAYNNAAAKKEVAQGHSQLNDDGATNPAVWSQRRHTQRTVEAGKVFSRVFGNGSFGTRIRPVLTWNIGSLPSYLDMLAWVGRIYGPVKDSLYGLAGAPYFSPGTISSTASVSALLEAMARDSDNSVRSRRDLIALGQSYGLKNLTYEGGPDNGGGDPTNVGNRILANRDPRMGGLVIHDIDNNFFQQGGDLFVYLSLAGYYSRYGSWGLIEDLTNLNTAKYKAITYLLDGGKGPPPPPPGLGAKVSDSQAVLSWPRLAGATSYVISRFDPVESERVTVAENLTATEFVDTALVNDRTYVYTLAARNTFGTSAFGIPRQVSPHPVAADATYADNLILNPQFADGKTGWLTFYSRPDAEGSVTIDTNSPLGSGASTRFDILKGGTQEWQVMLFQPMELFQGNTYEISFRAATNSSKMVSLLASFESSPSNTNYLTQPVVLQASPQTYGPFVFTAPTTDKAVNFLLRLGKNDSTTVWLGDIVVRQVGGDAPQPLRPSPTRANW